MMQQKRSETLDLTIISLPRTAERQVAVLIPMVSPSEPASHDPGAALAEADWGVALARAMGAEDRLVAVFEKRPRLTRFEGDRALAVGADLHQAAIAPDGRPRDRAAAEDVARQQVAAAAGVMRDELRHRPVEIQRVAVRHAMRREAFFAHRGCQQEGFECDVEGAALLVRLVPEVRERSRVANGARRLRHPERRQRLGRNDPGRDRAAEILAEER